MISKEFILDLSKRHLCTIYETTGDDKNGYKFLIEYVNEDFLVNLYELKIGWFIIGSHLHVYNGK